MPDRIEREIEDIMRKLDGVTPPGKPRKVTSNIGQPFSAAQSWLARSLAHISLKQVMMWALFVVIVGFFMRGFPGAVWIMLGGLIVFATAFVLSRGATAKPSTQKRWRGQPIDLSGPSLADRLKTRIKGRKRD